MASRCTPRFWFSDCTNAREILLSLFLRAHLKAHLRGDFYHQGAAKYGVQGYIVLKSTEGPPEGRFDAPKGPTFYIARPPKRLGLRPSPQGFGVLRYG